MDGIAGSTAGPVFSSSRIIRWSDLGEDERDKFSRFFAENGVSVRPPLRPRAARRR
jgi:hypothetical protein